MPKLKKDVGPLLEKGIDSLVLGIELFNRPSERGRSHSVLIILHHSFEMFLKAAIIQKTGSIHQKGDKHTYGFDKCLAVCLSLKIITKDESASLSILDSQRDIAMHYYQEISEDLLYIQAQAAVTLFSKLLLSVFNENMSDKIPARVLPISTHPPKDLQLLIDSELEDVDILLESDKRQGARAAAKLRSIFALATGAREGGERVTETELNRVIQQRRKGKAWDIIMPEVAQLRIATEGDGIPVSLRISKDPSAIPVRIVRDDEESMGAIVHVDWFSKYNLSLKDLALKLKITQPQVRAYATELKLFDDPQFYSEKKVKSLTYKRYTKKALDSLREIMKSISVEDVWEKHKIDVMGRR